MTSGDTAMTAARHDATAAFDSLRRQLGRPDLDDAVLRDCLHEALSSVRPSKVSQPAVLEALDALLAGGGAPDLRRAVFADLCLPPPAAPMAMPVQMLERDRAGRVGRLAALFGGRARQG